MRSNNLHIKTNPSEKAAVFSTQTLNARRAWEDKCQALKNTERKQ
jgi:hypothetical protein